MQFPCAENSRKARMREVEESQKRRVDKPAFECPVERRFWCAEVHCGRDLDELSMRRAASRGGRRRAEGGKADVAIRCGESGTANCRAALGRAGRLPLPWFAAWEERSMGLVADVRRNHCADQRLLDTAGALQWLRSLGSRPTGMGRRGGFRGLSRDRRRAFLPEVRRAGCVCRFAARRRRRLARGEGLPRVRPASPAFRTRAVAEARCRIGVSSFPPAGRCGCERGSVVRPPVRPSESRGRSSAGVLRQARFEGLPAPAPGRIARN